MLTNTLVLPPPGTFLIRQGARRMLVALALRDGDSPMPITDLRCYVCQRTVQVGLEPGVAGPRVNGDSRYGFEAMHTACALQEAARV